MRAALTVLLWLCLAGLLHAGDPELRERPRPGKRPDVAPHTSRPRRVRAPAPVAAPEPEPLPAPTPMASIMPAPPAPPGPVRIMLEQRRRGQFSSTARFTPSLVGTWVIGSAASLESGYATRLEVSVQERSGALSGRWLIGTTALSMEGRATPAGFTMSAHHDDAFIINTTYTVSGTFPPGDPRPTSLNCQYGADGASSPVVLTRLATR